MNMQEIESKIAEHFSVLRTNFRILIREYSTETFLEWKPLYLKLSEFECELSTHSSSYRSFFTRSL